MWKVALIFACIVSSTLVRAEAPAPPQVVDATYSARVNLRSVIDGTVLASGVTVKQLVEKTSGGKSLETVVQTARQLGGPRWLDDRTCQVRLAIPANDVLTVLCELADKERDLTPISTYELQRRQAEWRSRSFTATGSSAVVSNEPATGPTTSATGTLDVIPFDPPAWVGSLLEVDGKSAVVGSRLRTIRAAEKAATDTLREHVDALHVTPRFTIADFSKADATIRTSVAAVMREARVSRVEYDADGSVALRMTLDTNAIWRAVSTPGQD